MGMTSLQRLKIWSAYKNEYKILLRLGLPVLITEIGKIVVSFADTMMVGAYGTKELAAAAFVNNFFVVAIVMLIGFAAGATPLFGALYSQKKNLEMGQTIRVSLQLNAIAGVVFTVVMGVDTSEYRSADTTSMLNYGFTNYKLNTVVKTSNPIAKISVAKGKKLYDKI